MFARSILTAVALVAASAQAQLAITDPGPNTWWVAKSINTLAWNCNAVPSSETFNVVLSNSNPSILVAPLALIADVPNYMCSYSVSAILSSQPPSTTYTLSLANSQNISDIYTSTQFEIKDFGSAYPATTSASSGTSTGTGTGAPSSPTSASKTGAAAAHYIPVGMSMAAALLLGLVVA